MQSIEKRLTSEITHRIPPFIWPFIFSYIITGLIIFYKNWKLACIVASSIYTICTSVNSIFNIITEEVVLHKILEDTWLTKITTPRTITEQKKEINGYFDLVSDTDPLKKTTYIYKYTVRIMSPLNDKFMILRLLRYFFIPMFKLGIIYYPFLYSPDLIELATIRPVEMTLIV